MRTPLGSRLFRVLSLALGALGLRGAQPVIDLWPEGVPGLKANAGPERDDGGGRVGNIHHPSLTVYPAEHPNGTAVIICPGGGYMRLSFVGEGVEPARWLNSHGVTAFIIKNRLVEYGQPAPLQDILRAIRTVRSRAAEFGLKTDRIGVLGFSAGGHLAASAGTHFDDPLGKTGAAIDATSGRPDFMMLLYPVITMEDPYVHKGSRKALLGSDHPTPELMEHWSNELQVTAQTPPAFLVATDEDKVVPPMNCILMYEALLKAKVPVEVHLFEHGPHGFGLRQGYGPTSEWPQRAAEWMASHGWIQQ